MITTIYLIRHGQTAANFKRIFQGRSDIPLNETGLLQATSTAEILQRQNITFDVILSSPLQRAQQTAIIIKDKFPNIPLIIVENLIERSFGSGEGAPITPENYQKILVGGFSNQESEKTIIERGQQLLQMILRKYHGQSVLVVSHSHLIKALLIPYNPTLTFETKIINAGISVIQFNNDHFDKMMLNIDFI